MASYQLLGFAGGQFELSISRRDVSENIFATLAAYVDSGDSAYPYDLGKCYIDFQQEDKDALNTIHNFKSQEFIPNAKFAVSEYKGEKILIVVGESVNIINDSVLVSMELDLAIFLYVIYELKVQVNYSKSPIEVYNDILCQPEDEEYHGHCLEDLKESFENIEVYQIVDNSSLVDNDVYAAYAYYLLKRLQDQSGKWEEKTLNAIETLLLNGNEKIPYHNIALALLANQWNHSFLESYRCIERLFHIIKLEPFYNMLNTSLSLMQVSREIEDKISWRPNEEAAIQDIFKEIEPLHITTDLVNVKNNYDDAIKIEKWYYKQRNSIAHYRAVHEPLKFDNSEWNVLICFNFEVIEYLYGKYKEKM